jgi:hypothetical protein
MAATTVRRRLSAVERAERVEASTAELAAAVEALADSGRLAVQARGLGPVPPLQLPQPALDLGAGDPAQHDPHPGRRVRHLAQARRSGAGGGEGLRIFGSVTQRLRADEVASG